MSDDLAQLIAKKFITRRDVKAEQKPDGGYTPVGRYENHKMVEYFPWKKSDILAHLAGEKTYGHYLLGTDNTCKLFAFDVDLRDNGWLPSVEDPEQWEKSMEVANPLESWRQRGNPARKYMKYCFRRIAHDLALTIQNSLDVPAAITYSGHKGLHVYGLTGSTSALEARTGAEIVLETLEGQFEVYKGKHFFKAIDDGPESLFCNFSIEVFPKQVEIGPDSFGNLMRLPLGKHKKAADPTFFVDMRAPLTELIPRDPYESLNLNNPWE